MKHYLCMLCLAFMSNFCVNEAAATLLLEQTPTLLEPASSFMDDGSYQTAGVRFLPDYQRNLVGKQLGSRVNEGGKKVTTRRCPIYGFQDPCSAHRLGKGVKHPIPGLTCYEQCLCDKAYYKYMSGNCPYPKVLGGDRCTDAGRGVGTTVYYTQCNCPADYNLNACPTGAICENQTCDGRYKQTGCETAYNLTTQLANATCLSCAYGGITYYKCTCNARYGLQGGVCVALCTEYPLTACPAGGTCSKCPENNARLRLDSCDTSKGWSKSGNTCVAAACPAGYAAGVTTCASGSTKPDISLNGWSGGRQCGVCRCNNINSNCTSAGYPQTGVPSNANYDSCNTGCGSERIFLYKITSCKESYKLTGGECRYDVCASGYQKSACAASQKQTGTATTDAGTTCYQCKDDTCPSGYQKSGCAASQKQTDTKTTDAGTTCYLCKNDTCPSGYQKSSCSASQVQADTKTTAAGTTCYQCKDDTCPSGYQKSGCSSSQVQTGTTTTAAGTTCYQCRNQTCKEVVESRGYALVTNATEFKAAIQKRQDIAIGKTMAYKDTVSVDYNLVITSAKNMSNLCSEDASLEIGTIDFTASNLTLNIDCVVGTLNATNGGDVYGGAEVTINTVYYGENCRKVLNVSGSRVTVVDVSSNCSGCVCATFSIWRGGSWGDGFCAESSSEWSSKSANCYYSPYTNAGGSGPGSGPMPGW